MKAKGDRYERDILAICHEKGFTTATRTRPGRMEDQGDIFLTADAIIQCKDVATPTWREWLEQLGDQITRSRSTLGFIAWKRRGVGGRPPLHLAVMPLDMALELVALSSGERRTVQDGAA
jgi:Holliday junction resolvase